jgi:hypothetical protein
MGSIEKLIKEEAEDACVRPHSSIRLSAINKVDNNSTEEDNDSKRNDLTMTLETAIRTQALEVVASPCPPPTTIAAALILQKEEVC